MKSVRLGVIGLGSMGAQHARSIIEKKVGRCSLAAVANPNPVPAAAFDSSVCKFNDSNELIKSGACDAVLIATPHYCHTTIGIAALKLGLHVLVEKPISVHKADCEKLIAAYGRKKQVFAAMFNQRADPRYKAIKRLVAGGELGSIQRFNFTATTWFRSEAYYASGGWRATWVGEGGGVLLNQAPHQLDLLQWIFGMPRRVFANCGLGKRHQIEVEDEVTACLEYANGATGVFVTSTGEAPGVNRLEIAGDLGKVVLEDNTLLFSRNAVAASVFCKTSKLPFATPTSTTVEIPVKGNGGQHIEMIQNFVDAILDGVPLIAPAREGINSVELANAMLYSSLKGSPVELPLNGRAYKRVLDGLIAGSKSKKTG